MTTSPSIVDKLVARMADPGRYVSRVIEADGSPEPADRWAARAIAVGLMLGSLGYELAGTVYRAGLSATQEPPQPSVHVLTWDWRQQPDLDALSRAVEAVSGGTVHVRQVDTGSDEYAIVVSAARLDDQAAQDAYDRSLRGDGDE